MGFQFAHINSYSKQASKKGGGKFSSGDIGAEADRLDGACPHVEAPMKPNWIVGDWQAVKDAEQAFIDGHPKDSKGRGLRADALTVAAGVISMPNDMREAWPAYRDEMIGQLAMRYGERLRAVVEHKDEAHPHLHFYLVAKPGEKFDQAHDGKRAANLAKEAGELKGGQNAAYKAEMKKWQDWIGVTAQKHGLTRTGPRRARLGREEWKAWQIATIEHAELSKTIAEQRKTLSTGKKLLEMLPVAEKRIEAAEKAEKVANAAISKAASIPGDPWSIVSSKNAEIGKLEDQLRSAGIKPVTEHVRSHDKKLDF
jgi:hypothetical protein